MLIKTIFFFSVQTLMCDVFVSSHYLNTTYITLRDRKLILRREMTSTDNVGCPFVHPRIYVFLINES